MSKAIYRRLAQKFGNRDFSDSRRLMLQRSLAAGAGLILSGPLLGFQSQKPAGKRIVVIGAGFAGLACAHELKAAGYDVTVIEARNRIGGRVLSFNDNIADGKNRYIPGRNVEGGGELIGSNHPTWMSYARQFNLEMLDVTESEDAEFPIVLNGKRLTLDESNELWEQMDSALNAMNDDARPILEDEPWHSPNAAQLDARSARQWIDAQPVSDLCKAGITAIITADNGAEPEMQSYLGNLTQVKGGGVEAYWSDSEVYRCNGGNQQLAFMLAGAIGPDRIALKLPVTRVDRKGSVLVVTCADGRTVECDDLVVAVPPTTWHKVDWNGLLGLKSSPQMGTNVKYLAWLKRKFWKDANLAPDSLTDQMINMTWDCTDNQQGDAPACLNAFSGGNAARKCLSFADQLSRDAAFSAELEALYPGYNDNFVDVRFMDWPKDPWTLASYSFPAPGQVTTIGPRLSEGAGPIHFAGEHCCYKFVGYMEGALNSGASLARKLAIRDGLLKDQPPPASRPAREPELLPAG